jgi:PKD repeat protein
MFTEPENLVGPAPFGASFRIETGEPLAEVHWIFGDGKEERGADQTKALHAFDAPGVYAVETMVRSSSGKIADLTTIVDVTETLRLADLHFEGSPAVSNNAISGDAPVTVNLMPKTTQPLIQFLWEAPNATTSTITGSTIQATYRKEGTYTMTLIAQDPSGSAMRLPITINVNAPSAAPSFKMNPESGVAPLRVVFDASETFIPPGEDVAGFKWQFGDEERNALTQLGTARIEHTYTKPGQYTATLHVVLASGKELTAERAIIVRPGAFAACFTASRVSVPVNKGVDFDSSCTTGTPTSYLWDMRYDADPATVQGQSATPQYVYVFDKVGAYTVTLTVRDDSGNQDSKKVSITVTP